MGPSTDVRRHSAAIGRSLPFIALVYKIPVFGKREFVAVFGGVDGKDAKINWPWYIILTAGDGLDLSSVLH